MSSFDRPGFTLVELVFVVVIIGMVTAFALPRLDLGSYRADAATQAAGAVLRTAQRAALTRQYDVLVSADVSGRRIRLLYDANDDGLQSSGERATWRSLPDNAWFAGPPAGGLTGGATGSLVGPGVRTVDRMPTLVFHRDGSTSGDAEMYLAARVGGHTAWRALQVTQATGRVDWYRYRTTWVRGGI